jgi:hypothetical protein
MKVKVILYKDSAPWDLNTIKQSLLNHQLDAEFFIGEYPITTVYIIMEGEYDPMIRYACRTKEAAELELRKLTKLGHTARIEECEVLA